MTQVPLAELYIQIETETLPVLWMKQTNWPMPPRIAATLRLGLERKAIVVRVGVAGSAWQLAAPLREQVLVPVRWLLYHASHPLAKQHPILNLIMPIPTLLRMATNRKIETTKLDWPWRSFSHPTINTKKCNFSLFFLTFFLFFLKNNNCNNRFYLLMIQFCTRGRLRSKRTVSGAFHPATSAWRFEGLL